ncbi:MAG: hypothetical protein LBL13_13675 [Bacteroidales bacterium]|jgi:hypothetical protein|nr:hypothetical protein [Bacteroidales bacterium]
MEKKKLKKLVLNKSVVSSLTANEEIKIKGGAITDNCQTLIHEGCNPGYSWEDCTEDCTNECYTTDPWNFTCNPGCPGYTF